MKNLHLTDKITDVQQRINFEILRDAIENIEQSVAILQSQNAQIDYETDEVLRDLGWLKVLIVNKTGLDFTSSLFHEYSFPTDFDTTKVVGFMGVLINDDDTERTPSPSGDPGDTRTIHLRVKNTTQWRIEGGSYYNSVNYDNATFKGLIFYTD